MIYVPSNPRPAGPGIVAVIAGMLAISVICLVPWFLLTIM